MKADRLTKLLLAVIALFLGVIALKPTGPNSARADAEVPESVKYNQFQVGAGTAYISVFNARTGELALYGMGDGTKMSGEPFLKASLDEKGRPSTSAGR